MWESICGTVGAWLIATLAAERSAEVIVDSEFFAPFRAWLARNSIVNLDDPTGPRYPKWCRRIFLFLSKLTSCGWCTSMWTSILFAWCLPGGYFHIAAGDNIFIKILALFGLANAWHAIFRLIHRGRVTAIDLTVDLRPEDSDDGSV